MKLAPSGNIIGPEISFSRKIRLVGSFYHYHDENRKIHIWYGPIMFSK